MGSPPLTSQRPARSKTIDPNNPETSSPNRQSAGHLSSMNREQRCASAFLHAHRSFRKAYLALSASPEADWTACFLPSSIPDRPLDSPPCNPDIRGASGVVIIQTAVKLQRAAQEEQKKSSRREAEGGASLCAGAGTKVTFYTFIDKLKPIMGTCTHSQQN